MISLLLCSTLQFSPLISPITRSFLLPARRMMIPSNFHLPYTSPGLIPALLLISKSSWVNAPTGNGFSPPCCCLLASLVCISDNDLNIFVMLSSSSPIVSCRCRPSPSLFDRWRFEICRVSAVYADPACEISSSSSRRDDGRTTLGLFIGNARSRE